MEQVVVVEESGGLDIIGGFFQPELFAFADNMRFAPFAGGELLVKLLDSRTLIGLG